MTTNEPPRETHVSLTEARGRLGDLVTAARYGHTTIITRNGRPIARIAPLPRSFKIAEP